MIWFLSFQTSWDILYIPLCRGWYCTHFILCFEKSNYCVILNNVFIFNDDVYSLLYFFSFRWEKDVGDVVEAAVRGAGGITAARARLHAALLALHEPPPRGANRGPSLPYCGPGVRPGDVTMMPKNTEMSLLVSLIIKKFFKKNEIINKCCFTFCLVF